jgi:hypothetical protein
VKPFSVKVREILRADPRLSIVLAEILRSPPAMGGVALSQLGMGPPHEEGVPPTGSDASGE